ncbi:MAG: hypothetical protein FWD71_11665, partial [Oscillospiraceae bacterium]|nr:hypothetical protein [Oscillospiraceae bacterium]
DPAGSVNIYYDGTLIGNGASTNAGWQTYDSVPVGSVAMTAGSHVIKVEFPDGNINFQAMDFAKAAPATTEAPTTIAADTTVANAGDTAVSGDTAATTAASDNSGSNSNVVIIIIIVVVVVIVIVVIIILVTRKKPTDNKPADKK